MDYINYIVEIVWGKVEQRFVNRAIILPVTTTLDCWDSHPTVWGQELSMHWWYLFIHQTLVDSDAIILDTAVIWMAQAQC